MQPIFGMTHNSRQVQPGWVFCAYPGLKADGREFISDAIAQGAARIYYDPADGFSVVDNNVSCIAVPELQQQLSMLAGEMVGHPSRDMTVIGVTGTNGKTSTAYFTAQLLEALGYPVAFIGTIGHGQLVHLDHTSHTTPDAIILQQLLATYRQRGVTHVVMEVSSHALDQGRVNAIDFDVAALTNISQDHLDYHGTMQHYVDSKCRLMQLAPVSVINADSDYAKQFMQAAGETITYGRNADLTFTVQQYLSAGLLVDWQYQHQTYTQNLPLLSAFNAANVSAALGICLALGEVLPDIMPVLSQLQLPPGRMMFLSDTGDITVVIDYAHTPDALQATLASLRQHLTDGQLWCVFGCGGDRDRSKRPLMAKAVAKYADHIVVTEDNSRFETPSQIFNDIMAGFEQTDQVVCIAERGDAIRQALCQTKKGDVVLLAGKGHETTLDVCGKQKPCDERKIVMDFFNKSVVG